MWAWLFSNKRLIEQPNTSERFYQLLYFVWARLAEEQILQKKKKKTISQASHVTTVLFFDSKLGVLCQWDFTGPTYEKSLFLSLIPKSPKNWRVGMAANPTYNHIASV